MSEGDKTFEAVLRLLDPFNRKAVSLARETTFAGDLELDSLSVMDFVAAMEDDFDITIPLNVLPDLETVGQVCDMIEKIVEEERS